MLYAFTYDGDTLLVDSSTEQAAVARAFHEVVVTYDVDPDRLEQLGWPDDSDYIAIGEVDEPHILRGGS